MYLDVIILYLIGSYVTSVDVEEMEMPVVWAAGCGRILYFSSTWSEKTKEDEQKNFFFSSSQQNRGTLNINSVSNIRCVTTSTTTIHPE